MLSTDKILQTARQTLTEESEAVMQLIPQLSQDFAFAVEAVLAAKGKLIISGIGKSAIIAQKIVSSLNSTGTPAVFLHAADAIHGDMGIIQENDVVLCISKSGTSPEIVALLPHIAKRGNVLIAMTGNHESQLAKAAHYVLSAAVKKEADPNNLAPTTSTTAQLALGDAFTICLLKSNAFQPEDFAKHHPGGALGKQLTLTIGQIAAKNMQPKVQTSTPIADVVHEISSKRLGTTVVMEEEKIVGIITDGDLRRMLENESKPKELKARDIMSVKPILINTDTLAIEGLRLMKEKSIGQLVVVNEKGHYEGILHLLDLVNEGIRL